MASYSWLYRQTEPALWTVGHYTHFDGRERWEPESDHGSPGEAAARVRWLNGGGPVGICGARLTDDTGPWTHHYVCTKEPGHVDRGDRDHEDLTKRGAPAAKWTNPTREEFDAMYDLEPVANGDQDSSMRASDR